MTRERESSASHRARIVACASLLVAVSAAHAADSIEVLHRCAGWTEGTAFSRPLGIFFDAARNETYVADTGNHQVVVCDENGGPLYRFHHYVARDNASALGEPKSIVVDAQGRIYLTDAAAAYVDVLDPTGRSIATIAPPDDDCESPESFGYLALGPDGVYATLSCPLRKVVVIDADLRVARVVQLAWTEETELSCLTGLAVDAEGRVYVTDACASTMVQVYDASGKLVRGFGQHDTGFQNFSFPSGIALMRDGRIWVADTSRQVASAFDAEGNYLISLGGKGSGLGEFEYPSCLTTDGVSRVFVIERGGNRYQCFRVDSGNEVDLGLRHH